MIKIDPLFSKNKTGIRKSSGKRTSSAAGSSSFSEALSESIEIESNNAVEQLLNDLKDQERKFLDTQSMYELEKYKRKVKDILKLITDNGMETVTLKRRRRLNKADFTIINKIDEKLLQLTTTVTGPQNKAFNLMKQLEEIRGLILDLSH